MFRFARSLAIAALVCVAVGLSANAPIGSSGTVQAAPLLMPGKHTLYQRVISHPGAVLRAKMNGKVQANAKALRAFTVLYVYERKNGWLSVGTGTTAPQGWLRTDEATAWDQSLTMLFTQRTGRDPVVFYRDENVLKALCRSDNMAEKLSQMQEYVRTNKPHPDIIAAEPESEAIARDRFYLMPILETSDPFVGVKFLRVASVDTGLPSKKESGRISTPRANDPAQTPSVNPTGTPATKPEASAQADPEKPSPYHRVPINGAYLPRIGIAIVMDTTISMTPYIERCREVVRKVYNRLEQQKLTESVSFAIVGYRSSTEAVPEIEYTSKVVSNFAMAKDRKDLESRLAQVHEARVSSHDVNEDALAGIKTAVTDLDWDGLDGRIILLITDAGPLHQTDRYASVHMAPQEMNDLAAQKGIRIITVHVKNPNGPGRKNIAYAEEAFRELSRMSDGSSGYIGIAAPNSQNGARHFAQSADILARSVADAAQRTATGELLAKPEDHKGEARTPEEEMKRLADRLGYAIQLEFLGQRKQSQAPKVVSAWISDMDLRRLEQNRQVPAVEVAVLVTKNQLSDLHDQVAAIIDNAERTKKTDSKDFFQGILAASAHMARNPDSLGDATLKDTGVLAEFLEGLPYRSEVMVLRESDWYQKSIGEQTAFINRLKSKLERYEEYDKDRSNWESFGSPNAGDWVYRVPLNVLP